MKSDRCWVEVLVDCPGAQGFYSYEIPPELEVVVGDILSVPFGAQQVGAIALRLGMPGELLQGVDSSQLKAVESVVSAGFFPTHYWDLLHQVACYYQTPLMSVIRSALPPGLLSRSQRRLKLTTNFRDLVKDELKITSQAQKLLTLLSDSKTGDYSWRFAQQKVKGLSSVVQELTRLRLVEIYLQPPETVRTKQQQAVILLVDPGELYLSHEVNDRHREILECLKRLGGEAWVRDLLMQVQSSSSVLKTLEKKGWITLQMREVLRQDSHVVGADLPKELTDEQAGVLRSILAASGTMNLLLHGVTGSGKTEVYLQAIAPLLEAGKSALVLVPEIGLTPQLTDRFRARFGDRVWVYHSGLSEGERYDSWRQMLKGEPQVVIGTRSAIFAPLSNLGLIVLDEEHDSSFKQDQPAPCYHARTVAQWRSQLESCPLLLGSATPSLESWCLVAEDRSQYLSLPKRVHDRPQPKIEVVDMRQELKTGNRSIFSRSLQDGIAEMKEKGQQGILFIHRRGHSSHVSCRSCGYVMDCPNCDVSLSYHHTHETAAELLRCHYCGYTQVQPKVCPVCESIYFKHFGSGTQRVIESLTQEFPEVKALRFDSDTTRTKGAHRSLLDRFARGEADLLVGTQMLTKGLDLPQVTLVGVVAADGLLYLQDFRSAERACQTLLQVAGRSGRGSDPGRVILQTYSPDHPVIGSVVAQDYGAFVESELETRELMGYPPIGWVILIRLSSPEAIAVQKAARRVAALLQSQSEGRYEVLGPSPAMVLRVAQRYRWQVLLKGKSKDLTSTPVELNGEELRSVCGQGVSLTIDVDPINLM